MASLRLRTAAGRGRVACLVLSGSVHKRDKRVRVRRGSGLGLDVTSNVFLFVRWAATREMT